MGLMHLERDLLGRTTAPVRFAPLTKIEAEIIAGWRYVPPYDVYNLPPGEESVAELIAGDYFSMWTASEELVGFFCTGEAARVPAGASVYEQTAEGSVIDFGLGMDPALTGQGEGTVFVKTALRFAHEAHRMTGKGPLVRLTVAAFNTRARRVYEKLGFAEQGKFLGPGVSHMEFIVMIQRKTSPS